jgi:uncharacterized damage-inducible protein DinB
MKTSLVKNYIKQLKELYNGPTWLDENFETKLQQVDDEVAFTKPDGYIHSIAEVVSHVIEWRRELAERLAYGRRAKLTMESPNNWIPNQQLKKDGWKKLKTDLDNTQKELLAILEQKDDQFLETSWWGKVSYNDFVLGLIHHDVYHLGQIGLIFKMVTKRTTGN